MGGGDGVAAAALAAFLTGQALCEFSSLRACARHAQKTLLTLSFGLQLGSAGAGATYECVALGGRFRALFSIVINNEKSAFLVVQRLIEADRTGGGARLRH
jgi:hypothetical protein